MRDFGMLWGRERANRERLKIQRMRGADCRAKCLVGMIGEGGELILMHMQTVGPPGSARW